MHLIDTNIMSCICLRTMLVDFANLILPFYRVLSSAFPSISSLSSMFSSSIWSENPKGQAQSSSAFSSSIRYCLKLCLLFDCYFRPVCSIFHFPLLFYVLMVDLISSAYFVVVSTYLIVNRVLRFLVSSKPSKADWADSMESFI